MDKQDVINKLRAKAADASVTPEEARLFAEKADELEVKYKTKLQDQKSGKGDAILATDIPWHRVVGHPWLPTDVEVWVNEAFEGNDINYETLFGGE
jgi:hypothetical protein